MKKYLCIIFVFIIAILSNNTLICNEVNLSKYKIVNLHNGDSSIKILAGVANIRLKASRSKTIGMLDNNFKIIYKYLPDNRKISNQKERFNKYSNAQQQRILELEEILSRTFIVEFDSTINIDKFCYKLLKNNPNVEIAEPYYVNYACGTPNDPEIINQEVLFHIKAFEGWNICEGDSTVLIGVGDSGFDIEHKELKEQIQFNDKEIQYNGVDDDNNGYVDDYLGYNFGWIEDGGTDYYDDVYNQHPAFQHGLLVMGIIGARTNNELGIAGVSNKCKLIPIRIAPKNSLRYLYCYQSILYAAVRGCKVMNCSWGSATAFSFINQSIVDYAIACDVALIAASGNLSAGSITNNHCIFYPSGYYGVLGVGGCRKNDIANVDNYVIGPATRILAQSDNNLSLSGKIQIVNAGIGTSFAAPVVSGVLGILRSYKPELSAQEAIELVRVTSDSISGSGGFVPNRVNMYKALTTDANLIPSIILKEQYFETLDGNRLEKLYYKGYDADDTFNLVLKVKNILGDAKNITLLLEDLSALDFTGLSYVKLKEIFIPELIHNAETEIKIQVCLTNLDTTTRKAAYFKLLMSGENKEGTNFNDNFVFYVPINTKLNTIENEKLTISVNDNGNFGYDILFEDIKHGFGFTHKQYGDFLWSNQLVATFNQGKLTTDFVNEKIDYNPLKLSLLDTNNAINVVTEYIFPSDTLSVLKTKLKINYLNKSGELSNFTIGHIYDWDIHNNSYNSSGYFSEAIPEELDKYTAAAEFSTNIDNSVYVGSLVFINKNKYPNTYVTPQAAGCERFESEQKQEQEIIKGLSSGITKQINYKTDMQYIVGLQYLNPIKYGDEVECVICTGIEKTKEELANTLKECAKNELTVIKNSNKNNWYEIKVIENKLEIKIDNNFIFNNSIYIEIFDLLGNKILIQEINSAESTIDISNFLHGVYYIRLNSEKQIIVEKIIY